VARQLDISRTAAREIILDGYVKISDKTILKPGAVFPETIVISIDGGGRKFVGRGGDKLEAALQYFDLNVRGQVCLDVGASTGGFTDCLLKRGATKIYAIENGKNQLAAKLRSDPRVISMEEKDIREVNAAWFNEPITFVVVDVSFISLTKVLEPISSILASDAEMICLIKPQYEAGKGLVNKRGIVKDQAVRKRAVDNVCAFAQGLGLINRGILPFPVTPLKNKNQEFLIHYSKSILTDLNLV